MISHFGSPDRSWQFARNLARHWSTTRPPPISNFCTYANLRQVRIGINRAMSSLSADTNAAEKHAEFSDIPTAGSSQKYMKGKVKGG